MSEIAPSPSEPQHRAELSDLEWLQAQFEDDFASVESQSRHRAQAPDRSRIVDEVAAENPHVVAAPSNQPTSLSELLKPEQEPHEEAPAALEEPGEKADGDDIPPTTPPVVEVRHEVNYDEPLRLAFVSQERDAESRARHIARERREAWAEEGGKVRRIVKGIWNTYFGDFKELRFKREAKEQIRENGNVFIDETEEGARSSLQATLNRHTNDFEDMIHRTRGESREDLAEDNELSVRIKDFIRKNIDGELSDEALREEAARAVNAYGETLDKTAFHEQAMIADNLLAIRDAVVGAREHEGGIERVLQGVKISVGESLTGANTEARYNWAEKVASKISSTKIGSVVGPEAVLVAATVAGSVFRLGGTRALASALTLAPGAAGAVLSGIREGRLTEDERVQTARDMTLGRRAEAGSKRREQMQETIYEMAAASDMAEELHELTGEGADLDNRDALRQAFEAVANVRARIKTSEIKKVDLISYGDGRIEEEREALDLAFAYAKRAVRTKLENGEALRDLGLPRHMEFDDILEQHADLAAEVFDDDMDAKDRAFKKLKRRRVVTAGAVGAATGLLLGTAAQEVYASFDPTRAGLVEQLWSAKTELFNGQEHHTLLDGLVEGHSSHEISVHHAASGEYSNYSLGSNGNNYEVSADHTLVTNENGTIDLQSENAGPSVSGLEVNADGSLTDDAVDRLRTEGYTVSDHVENLTHDATKTESSTVNEFLSHHKDEVTKVTRDLWYDNDTPGQHYDKNELKLWWGGNEGTDGDGGFKLSTSAMTENGSFHDGESAQWRELAADGKLKLALSADTNSQDRVIMVNIDRDGNIDIPKGSAAAELFSNEDGHAVFNGKYAEVVQLRGEDASGTEHIAPLATLVGNESTKTIHDTYTTRENFTRHNYTITSGGYDTHERVEDYTEMAPVIPVFGRKGLESLKPTSRERDTPENEGGEALPGYGYYGSGAERLTEKEKAVRRETISPRLLRNNEAQLSLGRELPWYNNILRKKKGPEYVQGIQTAIQASKELSSLSDEIDTIVALPVNAAGEQEADHIYDLLAKGYAQQDSDRLKHTTVLLHVNWFDTYGSDEEQMRKNIERTRSEIERAKADFPDLNVATFDTEWKRADMQNGVIGHVVGKMNDVILLSLSDAIRAKRMKPSHDVLIVRSDSDTEGLDTQFLKKYNKAFEENRSMDVFTGSISFANTKAERLPGLAVATNFMSVNSVLDAKRNGGVFTIGRNFGIRASTLCGVGGSLLAEYSSAGSDDVEIGYRVRDIRNGVLVKPRNPSRRGGYGYGQGRAEGAAYKYGMRVDARVEANADREEAVYSNNIPLTHTWYDFDENGYRPRDAKMNKDFKEDLSENPDGVIDHIQREFEEFINFHHPSPANLRMALAFTFYGIGSRGYSIEHKDGRNTLTFTPEGREYLKKALLRDTRGRFDPYASRKARQLFGEVKPGSRRRPTHRLMYRI